EAQSVHRLLGAGRRRPRRRSPGDRRARHPRRHPAAAGRRDAQDPDRGWRLQHRVHPLHGRAHREAPTAALLPAHRVRRQPRRHHRLVPELRPARGRGVGAGELHRQHPADARMGRGAALGRRHRRLGRQHAEPAGDLEGPGHRRGAAAGLGSRHRPRRRQRRLPLLVRGGHDRLPPQGALDGAVPRVPQGQPLAALRRGTGAAAPLPEADRLRPDEARLRVRQRRGDLLRGGRGAARRRHACRGQ
ncbi:MAG: Peptidase E, partial [uncultured Gemmatimonadaceae bacterium]